MRKIITSVVLLSGMVAYAQSTDPNEGKVGINTTTPTATLEIKPNEENSKSTATTNEGVLVPKLTKERVANIASSNLVEGTLVYVDDVTFTAKEEAAVNTRVELIDSKGYYHYNGTQWVKHLDTDTNTGSGFWAQKPNETDSSLTDTYLVPANNNSDFVGYTNDKKFNINLGGITEEDSAWRNIAGEYGYRNNQVPYFLGINSSALPTTSTIGIGNNNIFNFSQELYKVGADHASAAGRRSYWGKHHRLLVSDLTTNTATLKALDNSVDYFSSASANVVQSAEFFTAVGNETGTYSPTVNWNIGVKATPRIYPNATATNVYGVEVAPANYGGNVNRMMGLRINQNTSSLLNGVTEYPTANYDTFTGALIDTNIRPNTTARFSRGLHIATDYLNGSITDRAYTADVRGYIHEDSEISEYNNIFSYVRANYGAANVTNFYNLRLQNAFSSDFTPTNNYGLYIHDVANGVENNYSVYTNSGRVRIGDLRGTGNRAVYADANGVLQAGEALSTGALQAKDTEGIQCSAATLGSINFKVITKDNREVGAFGFCTKNGDSFVWAYMLGGANIFTSSNATFGEGL